MPGDPFGEELYFSNILSNPPSMEFEDVSSCPISFFYVEEVTIPTWPTPSFMVAPERDRVSPLASFSPD